MAKASSINAARGTALLMMPSDAASGALPGTLQLTANPAGLPDGQNQATVTLNALDGSSQIVQTVTVHVANRHSLGVIRAVAAVDNDLPGLNHRQYAGRIAGRVATDEQHIRHHLPAFAVICLAAEYQPALVANGKFRIGSALQE